MSELYALTAGELLAGYASRDISPVETMRSVLARAEARNPAINALIFPDPDGALEQAKTSEARWKVNAPIGPLDGVPVTVKDSIAEASRPMWRGILANKGQPPVGYDAPPTARLKEAGAIIFAKTTMPDFGLMASGVSSAYGITRNPWNLTRNPGGSSSGGAASVAARIGPLTVGTDLGGSVRQPAGLCGLVGLKPTQGRIPHLPPHMVRSAGPLARTAADAALLLNVLVKPDERDYHALEPTGVDYTALPPRDLKGLRIGLITETVPGAPLHPAIHKAVARAAQTFADAGAAIEPLPAVSDSLIEAVKAVFVLRGYQEFEHLDQARRDQIPAEFKEWFASAPGMSALEVAHAQSFIESAKAKAVALVSRFDYLISPVSATEAFPAEATTNSPGNHETMFTLIWNQTGHPAISVCCGFDGFGVPIGLQIVGHRFDDAGVLQMAAAFETLRGFDMPWPQ